MAVSAEMPRRSRRIWLIRGAGRRNAFASALALSRAGRRKFSRNTSPGCTGRLPFMSFMASCLGVSYVRAHRVRSFNHRAAPWQHARRRALTLAEKVSQRSSPALLAGASKGLDFPLIALWQVAGLAAAAFLSALLCLQRQSLVGVGWPGIAALQSVGTQLAPRFPILHAAPGDFGHAPLLRQSARELQHFDIVERLLQDC